MKRNNNSLISMLRSGELRELKVLFNRITSVKSGRGWINWFNRIVDLILVGKKPSWTRATVVFTRAAFRLLAKSGRPGLVLYLKACNTLLMQAVGGMQLDGTRGLKVAVSRSADGFPRIIPRSQRGLIRAGDRKALRIWLSLFSLYRVIEYKGSLKLKTITAPGVPIREEAFWQDDIKSFFQTVGISNCGDLKKKLHSPVKAMIYKSSPSTAALDEKDGFKYSTSWLGIQQAAVSLYNSEVWSQFTEYHASIAGPYLGDRYWNFVKRIEALAVTVGSLIDPECPGTALFRNFPHAVGRLGLKQEAAGKVRVFAMVDCWTQWLMKPLHLAIFDLLDRLPTDGTHNQLAPIHRLIKQGHTRFWSFDLSSATDRLPVSLQAYLLNYALGLTKSGNPMGRVWSEILVNRGYRLPVSAKKFAAGPLPDHVMYAVGQPMGALSSWGMLALTHHFLVAHAARKVGLAIGSFSSYAILGDDIVIADGRVARQYLQLMQDLGVEIGLAKSLVSRNGVLEFAKRFYVKGEDCSPVPLAELAVAFYSGMAGLEFARKYGTPFSRFTSVLGYGYRVKSRLAVLNHLPKRLRNLALAWYGPSGVKPVALDQWVLMNSALEPIIVHTERAVLDFYASCFTILETVELRWRRFVKATSGFTWKDLPKPVWEYGLLPPGSDKPSPDDDRPWLTYFTIRDQIRQAFQGLKIDLKEIEMTIRGCRNVIKFGEKFQESDLMELRSMYSKTMLLRNVRQILRPRPKDSKESFDRVVKLRRHLATGIQKVVIRGEGFIMWDPLVKQSFDTPKSSPEKDRGTDNQ